MPPRTIANRRCRCNRSQSDRRGGGAARRCRPTESSRRRERAGDRIGHLDAGRFVLHAEHRRQRHAARFVVAPAGQPLGNGVHEFDAAGRVDGDHGIGDRRERHLRAFLLLQRLRLGLLAVRNIRKRAGHSLRLAALADHRASARAEPPILPIVELQPEFEIERISAREVFLESRQRHAAVSPMNAPHERAGRFAQRSRCVTEQFLEPRRQIEVAARETPVPDAVVGPADRVVVALLARAEGREKCVLLVNQQLRAPNGRQHQRHRDQQRRNGEHRFHLPRRRRERCGERALERRELAAERAYFDERGREIHGIAAATADGRMNCLRDVIDACEENVAFGPQPDAVRHEADRAKAPEQVDHSRDVGRVIACLAQPLPGDREIRKRFVQLKSCCTCTRDDARFFDIAVEVILVARMRVLLQRLDGRLLCIRPDALGADVGPYAANHLQACHAECEQQRDDRDERPDEPDQAPAGRLRRSGSRLRHGRGPRANDPRDPWASGFHEKQGMGHRASGRRPFDTRRPVNCYGRYECPSNMLDLPMKPYNCAVPAQPGAGRGSAA